MSPIQNDERKTGDRQDHRDRDKHKHELNKNGHNIRVEHDIGDISLSDTILVYELHLITQLNQLERSRIIQQETGFSVLVFD